VNDRTLSPATASANVSILLVRVGLIAGTLDIGENLIFNQLRRVTPSMVFHYIASGLIGMKAFEMGFAAVILGVVIHYAIAMSWTVVYYAASRKFTALIRHPVISGLLYGIVVYLIMNFVVLPLTGVPHAEKAMTLASRVNGVLALMLCFGLTIAWLLRRNLPRL
jgi:uncharacterized membrane protein YagU involved in acid resistance